MASVPKSYPKKPSKGISVVLGNQLIPAWYPSFYPSKAINDVTGDRLMSANIAFGIQGMRTKR